MDSKLITRIANRPNFYYFDRAIKDGKKITIKQCLFTQNQTEATAIAHAIKAKINQILVKRANITHINTNNLALLIRHKRQNDHHIKQSGLCLEVSEYKKTMQEVIANFYNVSLLSKESQVATNFNQQEQSNTVKLKDTEQLKPIKPELQRQISFKQISQRYVATECEKLKSSDKTKGYYLKTGKLLDGFFKGKAEFSYPDAENFQTQMIAKKLNKKTINNYTTYAKRLFDYAVKIGETDSNPFKMLTSFKISNDEKSPKDNFTLDELKIVFDTDRLDLRNYMLFALHTGLRLNEIWELEAKNVGEIDGIRFINVKTAKQKNGESKYRQIPLHENIMHLGDLKWLDEIRKGKDNSDYFGKRLNKYIHKCVPTANVSFHRLRGNFRYYVANAPRFS